MKLGLFKKKDARYCGRDAGETMEAAKTLMRMANAAGVTDRERAACELGFMALQDIAAAIEHRKGRIYFDDELKGE